MYIVFVKAINQQPQRYPRDLNKRGRRADMRVSGCQAHTARPPRPLNHLPIQGLVKNLKVALPPSIQNGKPNLCKPSAPKLRLRKHLGPTSHHFSRWILKGSASQRSQHNHRVPLVRRDAKTQPRLVLGQLSVEWVRKDQRPLALLDLGLFFLFLSLPFPSHFLLGVPLPPSGVCTVPSSFSTRFASACPP